MELSRSFSIELEEEGESGGRQSVSASSSRFDPSASEDGASFLLDAGGEPAVTTRDSATLADMASASTMSSTIFRVLFRREQTKNVGSHARDHLANERTFLAWVRTAMGSVGLGVAIAKLDLLGSDLTSKLAALLFVGIGAVFLLYCTMHYFRVLYLLNTGFFEANKWGVIFVVVACTVAVAICSLLLVFG